MEKALSFKGISKTFNSKYILKDVSFDIEKGKITAFLGQNGAGKTTTLRIATGLLLPDKGGVLVDQEKIEDAKKHVAFIPDYPYLYEELTGREYLKFIIQLTKLEISQEQVEKEIIYYGLNKEIDKLIKNLSLGNRKKLALLGTLLNRPSVLLLDEFIAGIDPINMKRIKMILKDYVTKWNNAILLSTHQLEVAETFCDALILIDNGVILKRESNLSNVLSGNGNLEEYFINTLHINGDYKND
ncbi:ABC transporter ATP-binding protein [Priestia endophytica]|uniref:ABC-2 type transport system ATP-binding protein n=1 Tax=Priestia endophytica DSM 13796 TaxID=1121089 RepID=A0A1I6BV67_9BACI|nr:ABC transporter ATP-binding protein [Priestia endophytica]KYG30796.1 hypothetical protein AZF06_23710 [Priestia endophytica]SFQ84747.1 ABC-2 type transport system ATP-binding protein [Priestia endophytica DSM 13796]